MKDSHATDGVREPQSLAPQTCLTQPADTAVAAERTMPATHDAGHCLDSAALLRGNSSVVITHRGAVYRLQATRQGKLILTK